MQKSHSQYDITPQEMYDVINEVNFTGIKGYRCPKIYWDYRQVMWKKKREEILKSRKSAWPPESWPMDKESGNRVKPLKKSFIDDQIAWSNSFCDKKKMSEIKEQLEAKGRKIEEMKYKSDFDFKKPSKDLRKAFMEKEKEREELLKKLKEIPEWKQQSVENAEEKIKADNEYKPRGKKSGWSKDLKVMYNAEGEFLGEQLPYWNPNPKEESKEKAEFNPKWFKYIRRSPAWNFGIRKRKEGEKSPEEAMKERDEKYQERANAVLDKMGVEPKKYMLEYLTSYHNVKNRGRIIYQFRKDYGFTKTDQYIAAHEGKNYDTPAPNLYWDDGKSRIKLRKNVEDEQAEKYRMSREKTDKRRVFPNLRKSVF